MWGGVPGVAATANHVVEMKPGIVSDRVGTPGSAEARLSLATPSAFKVPLRMWRAPLFERDARVLACMQHEGRAPDLLCEIADVFGVQRAQESGGIRRRRGLAQ